MRSKQTGFTILELMVVLAIAGIVSSIAYPNLRDSLRKSRIQSETAHLLGDLMFARSEAVKLNRNVAVCKSTDGAACAVNNTTFWDAGWIVFRDDGGGGATAADAGNGTFDASETLLRQSGDIVGGIAIRATADFENVLTYRPNGRSSGSSNQFFKICSEDSGGSHIYPAKKLMIEPTGRPRVSSLPAAENCVL